MNLCCVDVSREKCPHSIGAVGYAYDGDLFDCDGVPVIIEDNQADFVFENPNGEIFRMAANTLSAPSNHIRYIVTAADAANVFVVGGPWTRYVEYADATGGIRIQDIKTEFALLEK